MLFGESEYKQARRRDDDAGRRRVVMLLLFLVMALGVVALAPRMLDVLLRDSGDSGGPGALEFTPQEIPDVDLEPGEVRIDLGGAEEIVEAPDPLEGPSPPQEFQANPELLAQVRDRQEQLDPEGLSYLFQRILTDTNWSPTGVVPPLGETTALWQRLIDRPTEYRGHEVLVRGKLVSLRSERGPLKISGLPEGNPSGLNRYFTAFLHTGQKFFLVAVCNPPAESFDDREIVSIRGLFLQLFSYEIVHEGQIRRVSVPALVGRSFVRQEAVAAGGWGLTDLLMPAALGMAAAFVAILIVCAWIFRRGNERFDERLKEARARFGVKNPVGRRRRPVRSRPELRPAANRTPSPPARGEGD